VYPRFLVPGAYGEGDEIDLPPDEALHLARVLRLASGALVRVFDGRGREFTAVVTRATKSAASIRIGTPHPPASEPRVAITLAHAVLKGDKMDDVVRDAVMMGASAIQPIVTARSEVTLSTLERGNRRERWGRVAVSSAKQCGRAVLPAIFPPASFDCVIDALGRTALPKPALLLAEPAANQDVQSLADLDPTPPREATVVIGPEGGWTVEEVARGASVCRLVTLGSRTLRADAMATIAMAALFARWGEY
jgi:16S rRNA (uracil1498-N3)-methyltransferase